MAYLGSLGIKTIKFTKLDKDIMSLLTAEAVRFTHPQGLLRVVDAGR